MRDLSPWLGLCHIRKEADDARSSQQTLVAAWADSVEAFEREVHFYTNTHGLQMILAEEVLPANDWLAKHPDRKDAQRLAAKVSANLPVEIGTLGKGMTGLGMDGEPDDDTEGYLHIEEIKGVEPLDSQFGVHPPKTVPDALYQPLFGQPDPTPAEVAHYGSADRVLPLSTYAILDAAKVVNFVEMLEASGLEHRCLFKGEAAEEMRDVAPYVVRLEEDVDFTRNLFSHDPEQDVPWFMWDREPGIYVRSRGSLEEMWRHFRKFTKVQDEDGKWYYFRFWEGNSSYDYFDHISTLPAKVKSIFCMQSRIWIDTIISHCGPTGRMYSIEPDKDTINETHSSARPFIITRAEQQALLAGLLRPHAFDIQKRIRIESPNLIQGIDAWKLEGDILSSLIRLHAYGIFRVDILMELVQQDIYLGFNFEQEDIEGILTRICKSDMDEDTKYKRISERILQISNQLDMEKS